MTHGIFSIFKRFCFLAAALIQKNRISLPKISSYPFLPELSRHIYFKSKFYALAKNWILAGGILLFAGCAALQKKPVADLNRYPPEEIISRIRQNYDRIQTLIGRGRLIVELPGAQFAGYAKVLVKKPDSLFITAKAILGVEVGFFFADRKHFSSYSPLENAYYQGPVDQMNQLVLFAMKIEYDQLLYSVLGTAFFAFSKETIVKVIDNDYVFLQPWKKHKLLYKVDPRRFVVTEVLWVDQKGTLLVKQTFSRFRKIHHVWLPQIIRLRRPKTRERLTIYYNKVEVNKPIAASQFVFKIPENARQVKLDGK